MISHDTSQWFAELLSNMINNNFHFYLPGLYISGKIKKPSYELSLQLKHGIMKHFTMRKH